MLLMTDLQKNCVSSKTKFVSVKVYNITRIKKAKTLVNYISCDCKCKFDSTLCNSNQKRNNDKWQCVCKREIVGILTHVFVRILSV